MQRLTVFTGSVVLLCVSGHAFAQGGRIDPFACLKEAQNLSEECVEKDGQGGCKRERRKQTKEIYEAITPPPFQARADLSAQLDTAAFPDSLRQVFEENGHILSDNVSVSVEATDSKWLITDQRHWKYLIERDETQFNITKQPPDASHPLCVTAELLKRVGDFKAEKYYEEAIKKDRLEPAYELFYADYLRNFRGPQRPLFPAAEEHYLAARRKLGDIQHEEEFDENTRRRNRRGLIALHQADGFSLRASERASQRLEVFVSSINKYARDTTDFDGIDDARDLTSEAAFAESEMRRNRQLPDDVRKRIIREKEQFETFNRLRLRYRGWPVVDLFYRHQEFDRAQITNFFRPNQFNDISIEQYGVAIEKPFNFAPYFDLSLRGEYSKVIREGLIEFNPTKEEDIDQFETQLALSRFFGPNKLNWEFFYVFQDIDAAPPIPRATLSRPNGGIKRRDRQIFAATLTYQIFRPLEVFPRGIDLFGGILHDIEGFGSVNVRQSDVFIGTAFRGLFDFWDFTLQPTIFTSDVERDNSQANAQYRTNVSVLYRILDEEKYPECPPWEWFGVSPAFLHVVLPARHDIAIEGPDYYENFRVGISLVGQIFSTRLRGTSFLIAAGYEYQRFYQLKRDLSLFHFRVSMGF